jgi:hypothetical protein
MMPPGPVSRGPEQGGSGGFMGILGGNGGVNPGNLGFQGRDIGGQLVNPEPIEGGWRQQRARRPGQVIVRIYHETILTLGWRPLHIPARSAIAQISLRAPAPATL